MLTLVGEVGGTLIALNLDMSLESLNPFRRALTSLFAFAGACTFASGCSPLNCTLAGCGEAVTVELSEPLVAGEYELTFESELRTETCSFVVDQAGFLQENDCAHVYVGTSSFSFVEEHTSLEVSIEHVATGEAAQSGFAPQYTTSHPNGKACEPECRTAPPQDLDTAVLVAKVRDFEMAQMEDADEAAMGGIGGGLN